MTFVHISTVHDLLDSFVSIDQMSSTEALTCHVHVPIGNLSWPSLGLPHPLQESHNNVGLLGAGKSGEGLGLGLVHGGSHHGHWSSTLVPSITSTLPQGGSKKTSEMVFSLSPSPPVTVLET